MFSNLLKQYDDQAFVIRLKARFIAYCYTTELLAILIAIIYTSYAHLHNPLYGYTVNLKTLSALTGGLNQEVRQVVKLLKRVIPRMIEIELHLANDLKVVNADAAQIEQLMMNLGINARDAMPDGGNFPSKPRTLFWTKHIAELIWEWYRGIMLGFSLSDNGVGMDKETFGTYL